MAESARRRIVPLALLLGAITAAQSARTQQLTGQPPPTFRSGTTLVELDVGVTDRDGRFVETLTPEEFEIHVDGQRQTIASFELVRHDAVTTTGWTAADVSTNDRRVQDGRLYVLVLDDLQTHPQRSETVKAAARRFVSRSVGPGDRAAVVRTSGRESGSQDFTNSRERLNDAIDDFKGERIPSLPAQAPSPPAGPPGAGAPGSAPPLVHPAHPALRSVNDEEAQKAIVVLRSLRNWVTWMSGLTGRRKVLVLFSEGVSYDTTDIFRNVDAPLVEGYLRDTVDAAARHNVAIYAIDVRGLPGRQGPIPTIPDDEFFTRESFRAKLALRALAAETGGFALTNSNDFDGAFERIVDESSRYYLLAFEPAPAPNRAVHTIDVRVKRQGVTVRSRRSFVSSDARLQPAAAPLTTRLDDLLRRALPQSGVSMSIGAVPLRARNQPGSVVVAVEVLDDRGRSARSWLGRVAVRIAAVGKDGKVRASRSLVTDPSNTDARRVRVVSQLPLGPGQYQLRAAAIADAGSEGSVHHDLDVPDLSAKPIALGGPLLAPEAADGVPTSFAPDDLTKQLPVVPTLSRVFRSGDVLIVFNQLYDNEKRRPDAAIELSVQIANERDEVMFAQRERVIAAGATDGGTPHLVRAPLDALQPGEYTLTVEARSSVARSKPVVRRVPLRIVP